MSLRFNRPTSTPWTTVGFEIVEGFWKAVVLIASAGAVVVFGVVLAAVSSLP
jgi:hypothetical protein